MSDTAERQSLLLPVLMPVGLLALIALVLFGLSRILLAISHAAATVVALVGLIVVLAVAAFVASRRQVSGASLFWMVSAIAGVIVAVGGLAVVAAPLPEEIEPQAVTIAAGPNASVDGFTPDALEVGSGAPIEMEFDNKEEGVQHNVVLFDGEDAEAPQLFAGRLISGPNVATYAVPALPEGSFFFHCEVHPTTMTGEIASVPGAAEEEGGGGAAGPGAPIVAQALQFSTGQIALPADEPAPLTFDNQDPGQIHNVAIYGDESLAEVLFQGETITGPESIDYEIPAIAEGEYYFQCDTHPDVMTGTVIVAPAPGGGADGGGGGGGEGGGGGGDPPE